MKLFRRSLLICPVRNGVMRPAILLLFTTIYAFLLTIVWRRQAWRYALIAVAVSVGVLLVCPARRVDSDRLREAYPRSLRNYLGTRYVWGEENHVGIDCSGLIRAGMVDALFQEGVETANPGLIRTAASLWWHDIAARDMPGGYDGRVEVLFSGTIRDVHEHQPTLQPGDVAVSGDGSHVIAYLGGDRWIEADPNALRVVEWNAADQPDALDPPRIFLRWRYLK